MATKIQPYFYSRFFKKKDKNKIVVTVEYNFVTKLSFWNALKIRLAGGMFLEKFIRQKIEEMKEDSNG